MDRRAAITLITMALLCFTVSHTTAIAQNNLPVCPLIATGGTIAMKIDPVKKAPVPAISGEDLVATVPDVSKYAKVEVNNISNVPSDYMDPPRWIALSSEVSRALARPELVHPEHAIRGHGEEDRQNDERDAVTAAHAGRQEQGSGPGAPSVDLVDLVDAVDFSGRPPSPPSPPRPQSPL